MFYVKQTEHNVIPASVNDHWCNRKTRPSLTYATIICTFGYPCTKALTQNVKVIEQFWILTANHVLNIIGSAEHHKNKVSLKLSFAYVL